MNPIGLASTASVFARKIGFTNFTVFKNHKDHILV